MCYRAVLKSEQVLWKLKFSLFGNAFQVPEVPKKPVPEKRVAVAKKEVSPPVKGTESFESEL